MGRVPEAAFYLQIVLLYIMLYSSLERACVIDISVKDNYYAEIRDAGSLYDGALLLNILSRRYFLHMRTFFN